MRLSRGVTLKPPRTITAGAGVDLFLELALETGRAGLLGKVRLEGRASFNEPVLANGNQQDRGNERIEVELPAVEVGHKSRASR